MGLIQKICTLLVETRGFNSVGIGVIDPSNQKVLDYAVSGQQLSSLKNQFESGQFSHCIQKAIESDQIILQSNCKHSCLKCPAMTQFCHTETMISNLTHQGDPYGFIVACLPGNFGGSLEEQDLFREMANDIAFALHSIEIKKERDKSAADLSNMQEQFRQAQKLEAIGRLAGGLAHDFNNILMVQMGYCELIKKELNDENPIAKDLSQIKECADRAAALIHQLLAFSRKQALQPKVLNLNLILISLEKMLKRLIGEDIEFRMVLPKDLGMVMADKNQIEQVIMNLVVNARDAMPKGGQLIIETGNVTFDEKYIQNHMDTPTGSHILLAISDTGYGMDEITKQQVFEPFFTTKSRDKGTGLGLSTVYGIVKQSGGNIWVYSEPEKGSTFKIYFPRVKDESTQIVEHKKNKPRLGAGEQILIVEDDSSLRKLITRMIKSLGYRVTTASNGGEALMTIENEGLRPDLIITDVVMPGISGKVLTERLMRIKPDFKVLYMSGYTGNAIVHHGVPDSNQPFLQKPFNIIELAAKINELLT